MSDEFLDYIEDILDAMDKAENFSTMSPTKNLMPIFGLTLPSSELWKL